VFLKYVAGVMKCYLRVVLAVPRRRALIWVRCRRCGHKELKFIERSGAYFGFLFGLIQAVVWFFVPEWCVTTSWSMKLWRRCMCDSSPWLC